MRELLGAILIRLAPQPPVRLWTAQIAFICLTVWLVCPSCGTKESQITPAEITVDFSSPYEGITSVELQWKDYKLVITKSKSGKKRYARLSLKNNKRAEIHALILSEDYPALSLDSLPEELREKAEVATAIAGAVLGKENPLSNEADWARDSLVLLSAFHFSIDESALELGLSFWWERWFEQTKVGLSAYYSDSRITAGTELLGESFSAYLRADAGSIRWQADLKENRVSALVKLDSSSDLPPESEVLTLAREAATRALKFAQSEHADPPPDVIELLQRVKDTLDSTTRFDSYGPTKTGG